MKQINKHELKMTLACLQCVQLHKQMYQLRIEWLLKHDVKNNIWSNCCQLWKFVWTRNDDLFNIKISNNSWRECETKNKAVFKVCLVKKVLIKLLSLLFFKHFLQRVRLKRSRLKVYWKKYFYRCTFFLFFGSIRLIVS